MAGLEDARSKGESAIDAVRVGMAERAAELLRRDPGLTDTAVEVGLVDRAWLEEPGHHPVRSVAALDVVQRFLERSVERRPSALGSIGLNALQLLAYEHPVDGKAETRQTPASIVFTDLEGFTRFTSRHGDEAALGLLGEHHRVIGPIVRSRGGKVVKRLGDGLMLSFPSAEAAVMAALELVEVPPGSLRLRAGVHTGEAVVTADDLIGHDVNVAARVAAAAHGGQVLATVAVRSAVGDLRGVAFGRARRRSFKGVEHLVQVCPVQRSA
ncbi:MAG: adenylate/guanylate cyclase domain-containing protein [Acidimicrobiales bacterium]